MSVRSSLYYRRGSGGKVAIEDMSVSTGKRFFVDSGNSAAADDSTAGFTPDKPIATLAYAVSACTANKGDIIYLMPGHNENIADAQIAIDKAGVSVIGMGSGTLRPRFDFDHANASIDITAKRTEHASRHREGKNSIRLLRGHQDRGQHSGPCAANCLGSEAAGDTDQPHRDRTHDRYGYRRRYREATRRQRGVVVCGESRHSLFLFLGA